MALFHISEASSGLKRYSARSHEERLGRAASIALPAVLLLLWSAAVRLPFYAADNGDEYFFSMVADEWLRGGLPYVATFDVKPPGLFFIYAAVQSVFASSHATVKGMEIAAVALGAYGLYAALKAYGTARAATWVGILYPVYTLAFDGTTSVNLLLQLPLIILGFAGALAATRSDAAASERMRSAFLAGLAIGAAGMVKQTAIFEALAIFTGICVYGERPLLLRFGALFVAGAALPATGFALYYLAGGHFHEMFEAVVVLALQRTAGDVAASYGPGLAHYLTLPGAVENGFLRSAPLIFLWGGALLAPLRHGLIRQVFPMRILVIAGLWLAAAFAGAATSRLLDDYYLLVIVPPLLVIASAFYCHGLELTPRDRRVDFVLSIVLAATLMFYVGRREMFWPDPVLAGDHQATHAVSRKLMALGLASQDRLLVLNRGLDIYAKTGARPPLPYFHPTHLLGAFPTPAPDPLGLSLATNPRFIVIADPNVRHVTELSSRFDRALAYVATHYRPAAVIMGSVDSFTIYEFAG